MMINRDGSPSAITGASVPETWYADFRKITAPLAAVNPKWPFKLERGVPRAHATSPGGTDSSSFEMLGVPTLQLPDARRITIYWTTPGTPSTTSTANWCPTRSTSSTRRW